jgi:hypothetical protein
VKRTAAAALLLAFSLAACGGTPNTPDGSFVNSPGGPTNPPPRLVKAALIVTVPRAASKPARGARYVSPKTESVVVALASVSSGTATTIDVRPRAPGCKQGSSAVVCRGVVDAVPGNDVFNVTTFAGPDGTGPVLSAGPVTATIASSSGNVVVSHLSLALDGIVAALRLTINPPRAKVGKPGHADVTVTAYDAAGAAIVGASAYSVPIVLSIQGDSAGAFSLHEGTSAGSSVSVAKPAVPIALLYDGSRQASSIALQASIAGANLSATATFTLSGTGPPPIPGDIYVLNAGPNGGLGATVTVFDAKATGNAAPKLALQLDPKRYAQTIALDANQRLYVGYFDSATGANAATGQPDSGNEIAVFAEGASGSATPVATIVSAGASSIYPASIAFDAAGDLVTFGATTVDGNGGNDAALIYAPNASGGAAPIHAWGFTSPYFHFPGPTGLALDGPGNFYVAGTLKTSLSPQSGVFVAAAADSGNAHTAATRTLPWDSGTGLIPGQAGEIGLDASGEIYVGNFTRVTSGGCQAQINAYAAGSTGGTTDVAPLRIASIDGFATANTACLEPGSELAAHFPALAVFGAFVYASDDFNNAIAEYPIGASGSVSPSQTISGSATSLDAPIAIAIAPASTSTLSARGRHVRYSSQDAPR